MTDIFAAAKEKVMPEWAKFINDGDSVQGTYVGRILGQKDGYGNEQIIYQLLQGDGKIVNVGFGLNKKVLNQDMVPVNFGQIVGFRYKGTIKVKNKVGQMVDVKDFALHQDPKIVNEVWLRENQGNMPEAVTVVDNSATHMDKTIEDFRSSTTAPASDDVPFSSEGSLTHAVQIAIIEKLAKDKLGVVGLQTVKEKVMETLGDAFIPVNYQKIIDKLAAL